MPCSGVLLGLIPGRTPKPVFSPSARPPERGVYPTALRGGGGEQGALPSTWVGGGRQGCTYRPWRGSPPSPGRRRRPRGAGTPPHSEGCGAGAGTGNKGGQTLRRRTQRPRSSPHRGQGMTAGGDSGRTLPHSDTFSLRRLLSVRGRLKPAEEGRGRGGGSAVSLSGAALQCRPPRGSCCPQSGG